MKESVSGGGAQKGERESQPDSMLSEQRPMWGSIPQNKPWIHDQGQNQESNASLTEPTRCP